MFLKPFRAIFMLPKNQQRSADRYAFAQSESLQDGSEATTVRLLGEGEGRPPPLSDPLHHHFRSASPGEHLLSPLQRCGF